jgi:uncharacterized phiE125 gp8 family phage protein
MTLTRASSFDGEAILPLADAKASARITHDSEDAVLTGFRDAALAHIERLSGLALGESEWLWTMPRFLARIDLPIGPVSELGAVKYYDADGVERTYADGRLVGGAVYPAVNGTWPTAYDYASVAFTAGPPDDGQLAVLIVAAQIQFQIFENRGRDDETFIDGMEAAVNSVLSTLRPVLV